MVGLDLYLSVECRCKGYVHVEDCVIQSKLPMQCTVAPHRWLIQYGRFIVPRYQVDVDNKPIIPYRNFREFRATIKSPVKKNSKENGTYFCDVDIPTPATNFISWVVSELEKVYGSMKHQKRLHIVLTNKQWQRIDCSNRRFEPFRGTVKSVILVQDLKDVNVKTQGIPEDRIIWTKKLRSVADCTTLSSNAGKLTIHRTKKQCYVGCFLLMLFMVIIPALLFFFTRYVIPV